jgi:hypothetical protein
LGLHEEALLVLAEGLCRAINADAFASPKMVEKQMLSLMFKGATEKTLSGNMINGRKLMTVRQDDQGESHL